MENLKEACVIYLEKFLRSPVTSTDVIFLEICTSVGELMKNTSELMKKSNFSVESSSSQILIIINFSQMISCLDFLSDIMKEEHQVNLILEENRKVAINRIKYCLDIIEDPYRNDLAITEFGLFLRWMDNALNSIAEINNDKEKIDVISKFKEAKTIYEDILAHAMSIAQICLDEDSKIINGSCKTVLDILGDLENELNKEQPNNSMVSLFIDDTSNKLCSLERKVDTAVLRLSLFVFSKYCCPLGKLFNFCKHVSNDTYDSEELDNIIANFDLHVDRIFQIGLFAVFCSSNIKSGTKIRNCMASLEFLETELVPSMKMIMKNGSMIQRTSALIYKNYWICEANRLKNLVYEIIDPLAFSKVIYNEITLEINDVLERNKRNEKFSKHVFDKIFDIGKVLVEFLLTVVRIEAIRNEHFKNGIRKCNLITSEIGTAIDVLEDNNVVTNDRILKRCKILQAEVEKLLFLLKSNDEVSRTEIDERMESTKEENMDENMLFSHIVGRGKEILENRSIMYRTPKNCKSINGDCDEGKLTSMTSFNMKLSNFKMNFSFCSLDKNNLASINIKDIFMNLSELTLSIKTKI
ncbi:serendipity locus protein alpha isoform X1 [Harmonia axyridis]|uniref:serendipity locus protein alpha isoform X1 n=1 Tax=Harmonia axyridis TaxID=115357 RepID=UPI001E275BD1|nr:serendipity locus protein alpha isoform X1 [Harmonia axyridis]